MRVSNAKRRLPFTIVYFIYTDFWNQKLHTSEPFRTLRSAEKLHYVNCIITWIRNTSATLEMLMGTFERSQYKIYRQAAAESCSLYFPVARRLHPSEIYLSRRLGKDCSWCRGRGCEISLPLFYPFILRHFRAGSPNTDRRLFQSALAIPVHLLDAYPPRARHGSTAV